jgi:AraC-like DNA-binding protein
MGCSRRMADLSFRRATGHTILDEIHSRRLEEAKTLLMRDDIPIEEIPTRLGYDRGPFLGILFRRAFGCSMRQWRKKNRHSIFPNR